MKKIWKRMIAVLVNLSLMVGTFYYPVEASAVDIIPEVQDEFIEEIRDASSNNLPVPGKPRWKAGALATAEWDAVGEADYYDIVVRVYQGDTFIGERETGTSATHADLQQEIRKIAPADAYQVNVEFKVRSKDLDSGATSKYSFFSEKKAYSVNAMAELDPPTEVSLVLEGDSLFVYFKPVENADHYKVTTYIVQNNVGIGGSVDTNDGKHGIVMKDGFCVVDLTQDFAQSYESYLGEDVEVGGHVQAVTADGNESACSNDAETVHYRKDSILPTPVIRSISVTEDGETICRFTDETAADDYDVDIVFKNFMSGEGGTERNPEERTTRLGGQMSSLCGKPVKNADGEYVIDLLPELRYWLQSLNAINPTVPTDVEIRIRSISGETHSAFSNVIELKDYITEPYYIAPANVVLTETEDGYYELSFDRAGDAPIYSVDYYIYKEGGRAQQGREFTLDEIQWDGNRGTVDLTKEFRELYNEVDGDDTYWFDAVVRGKSTGAVERGLRSEYSNKVKVYKNILRKLKLHPEIPVVAIGKSLYIGKEVVPFYGYYKNIVWSTEDESIATVDQAGKVTGVAEGYTIITAVVDDTIRSSVSVNVYEMQTNLEDVSGSDSLISQAEDIIDDIANIDDPDISKTDIDPESLEQIKNTICDGAESGNSFHTDMVSDEKTIQAYRDELDKMEELIGTEINPPVSEEIVSDDQENCFFVCGYDVSIQVYHKDKAGRKYRVGNIVETNDDISFYLEIPKNMHWTTGGDFSFYLLREHNGEIEKIPVTVNADGSFSVVSDKFSDFVLVATNKEAETDKRSHATKVTVSPTALTIMETKSEKLTATLEPAGCIDEISWTTSNASVATVTADGTVTGVKAGTCEIMAITNSGLKAECKVTVTEKNVGANDEDTTISKEDIDTYVIPKREVVSDNKVALKLSKNSNVTVNIPISYNTAVTFQNRKITLSDLGISAETKDILNAVNIIDKDPATLIEVKAVFKNSKNATAGVTKDSKRSSFYVKLSVKKDAKNQITAQELKTLKKAVREANKALKKQKRFFTINKASLADLNTKVYFKNATVDLTPKGAVKGLKKVTVTINGKEKKLATSQYDKKNMKPDKEQNTVTITGKKNYTGSVTVKVQ